MKNSNKDFGIAGQSATEVKKSQKHDANLQKNSTLYFQIGLILCLLGTYALFEMQFQEQKFKLVEDTAHVEKLTIDYVPPYVIEEVKVKQPTPKPSVDLKDVFKVVDDNDPVVQDIVDVPVDSKPKIDVPFKVGDIPNIEKVKGPLIVDFISVEKVPVYPGCEKYSTNMDRKKCMSDKITKLIGKKFNIDIGSNYGISGKQKIYTQFTIDKMGNVSDVKIRGPHPALEKEANRVINKIPKMKPGIQGNVPVGVIYTLPISYQVSN